MEGQIRLRPDGPWSTRTSRFLGLADAQHNASQWWDRPGSRPAHGRGTEVGVTRRVRRGTDQRIRSWHRAASGRGVRGRARHGYRPQPVGIDFPLSGPAYAGGAIARLAVRPGSGVRIVAAEQLLIAVGDHPNAAVAGLRIHQQDSVNLETLFGGRSSFRSRRALTERAAGCRRQGRRPAAWESSCRSRRHGRYRRLSVRLWSFRGQPIDPPTGLGSATRAGAPAELAMFSD